MRLTTINVDKFQHDGLVVDRGWSDFNYAKADAKARASFREHYGRFVRIHPEDIAGLAKLGLAIEDGRIVDAKPEADPPKSDKVDAGGAGKAKPEDSAANGKAAGAKGKAEEGKTIATDEGASAKGKDAAK